MTTQEILEAARGAKAALALADSASRAQALCSMAAQLCSPANMTAILAANADDMAAAEGHISEVMLDRLALTEERIRAMAKGIEEVAALPDPVGRVLKRVERPNGLVIEKTAVPMGVIAIIYESRPNVTSDATALAIIKSLIKEVNSDHIGSHLGHLRNIFLGAASQHASSSNSQSGNTCALQKLTTRDIRHNNQPHNLSFKHALHSM